ncbi:glycosyltransferase [uncultured Polaribacter sp.]|uniref:glycosyltransferase n=1 Tax=uncultured Polaribacter sp. TaxID=174711 RepID=UPI0026245BBB|nr:glycosyltransferase [uncultured Polaribacter sp.]
MRNKKGVIQVIDSLNAGGAEVLAVNIANGLADKGNNSHICTTRNEGVLKSNVSKGVGYLFLNKKKAIDISAIIKFINYIKLNNIRIIHAHSSSYFFAFCIKILHPQTSVIWHDHYGKNLQNRKLYPLKICSYFFKSIISVNRDLKKWAQIKLNCKQVYFLNNFPEFIKKKNTTVLKGVKGKRIVHLAAFREQKDHLNLLKAFKVIHIKYSEYTLHLVGKINTGSYSTEIINFIKENKLTNVVFLYGVCTDIKNILNQSDIGVLSSKSEGLPVSLLEYGLAKLPVLVTDVGECKKVINCNKAVVIAENSNIFAEYLMNLIKSENLRNKISSTLNKNVEKNFSKNSFILKIEKFYKNS